MKKTWAERWEQYRRHARESGAAAAIAQTTKWDTKLYRLHQGLLKAQSTVATLLRTEHVGLNDYLCRRKVPGYDSPLCDCGWPRQTVKHIVLFCLRFARDRDKMIQEAATSDYTTLPSTARGLRAATKSFLEQNVLTQFSLAREAQAIRTRKRGRRAGIDVDDG